MLITVTIMQLTLLRLIFAADTVAVSCNTPFKERRVTIGFFFKVGKSKATVIKIVKWVYKTDKCEAV